MKEIEITDVPPLSPGEQSLLELHGVVNVLNVLRCELTLLGLMAANNEDYFREGLVISESLLCSLHEPKAALREAARIGEHETVVFRELERKLAGSPLRPDERELAEGVDNLRAVFAIMKVRAQDILARAATPERWTVVNLVRLHADFLAWFELMEKHSKGRFRIRCNSPRQGPQDYCIDFSRETADGATIRMPDVFEDVMRDLIANARKYTAPGGNITAALREDATQLRFTLADTGRGIPEAELAQVVQFGRRASNVGDVRTMGGGFGLTKAFFVTKRFGGRFWIASELGKGTRIRIQIPMPSGAGAPAG